MKKIILRQQDKPETIYLDQAYDFDNYVYGVKDNHSLLVGIIIRLKGKFKVIHPSNILSPEQTYFLKQGGLQFTESENLQDLIDDMLNARNGTFEVFQFNNWKKLLAWAIESDSR